MPHLEPRMLYILCPGGGVSREQPPQVTGWRAASGLLSSAPGYFLEKLRRAVGVEGGNTMTRVPCAEDVTGPMVQTGTGLA